MLHVHHRHTRRRTECRDELVTISPYLTEFADPTTLAHGSAGELAPPLRRGLHAHARGEPVSTTPVPVAVPVDSSLDADTYRLVALSRELRRTQPHNGGQRQ